MNKLYRSTLWASLLSCLMLISCVNDDNVRHPDFVTPVTLKATNVSDASFILQDLENESFSFTFDYENYDGSTDGHPFFVGRSGSSSSLIDATLLLSYNGTAGRLGPVEITNVSEAEMPMDLLFSSADLLNMLGLTEDQIDGGDQFVITYEYTIDANNSGEVRKLTTPGSDWCGGFTPEGEFCFFAIDVVCESPLAGTYDYSTTNLVSGDGASSPGPVTGSGTLVSEAVGVYTLDDASFGLFAELYGDDPAIGPKLVDTCELMEYDDTADQYSDTYELTGLSVSDDGLSISFNWTNTFGDGATTVLTRTDGNTWPEGLFSN